ncbi:CTD phosphatase Fcp1 [Sporothrix epigloea]|uniref:RNA polymerase II subunit A C-terminal domain phosphatase n=1 Tax=Sporothrix epigloea TaxID=1892477 RepID=A0ABP0DEZ9_9PEZI
MAYDYAGSLWQSLSLPSTLSSTLTSLVPPHWEPPERQPFLRYYPCAPFVVIPTPPTRFSQHVRTKYAPPVGSKKMATGVKGEKDLHLGARLKYPIKITKLYKTHGDTIKRQEPILQYSYEYTMELPQDRETLELRTQTLTSITDWNAPEEGKLLHWNVRVGDVVTRDRACVTVEEACTHEVQFQGLCAICGRDMSEVNWASEQRDTARAPINMIHDQTNLKVSRGAATRAEKELQQRLLAQRKLSLVVDLDQTIIHACIDPTIGEWQQDATNPNYEALRDVQRFQLEEGQQGGVARGCFYYIKMRPGLAEFLSTISTMYELHVYTMGTRTYATNIAKIVDPEQRLFGNRLISRDENGNIVAKSLQRLFPVSTHMAVIIDDRADVWPHNRHNLIKVMPYDFFKGTGDINSSFLPKRDDLQPTTAAIVATPSAPVIPSPSATTDATVDNNQGATSPATSTSGTLATSVTVSELATPTPMSNTAFSVNGGGNSEPSTSVTNGAPQIDVVLLQKQTEEQERVIEKQIKDRPLLHMQEQLDKQDSEKTAATAVLVADAGNTGAQARHCILNDGDAELEFLKKHLTKLHHEFYKEYDAVVDDKVDDSNGVPDVGEILDRLKGEVLQDETIVLSGLVPLGLDVEQSEIGRQALNFGAKLQRHVSRKVTHLVISSDRPRTQKVRQAARIPTTKIVNQNWLLDCFSQWSKIDETPYLIDIHPSDRGYPQVPGIVSQNATDTETISNADTDSENEDDDGNDNVGLHISGPGRDSDDDEGEFDDFNNSDGMSPIAELGKFDWGSADDELEMFLAEGDDEDDDEDEDDDDEDSEESNEDVDMERNGNSEQDPDVSGARLLSTSSKRKLGGSSSGGRDIDTDTDSERTLLRGRRLLVKRQRLASRSRSTSQRRGVSTAAATSAGDRGSGSGSGSEMTHPLRQQTTSASLEAQELRPTSIPSANSPPASVDIDEAELEAMLMAELDEEEAAEMNGSGDG